MNRIATVTDQGLEYEAGPRHAEILIKVAFVDGSSDGEVIPRVVSTGEGDRVAKEKLDSMKRKFLQSGGGKRQLLGP